LNATRESPLRVIGTPGTETEDIRVRAEADLGFEIQFTALDGLQIQRRTVTDPASFDVLDHWSLTTELAWTARAIQPIDLSQIARWKDVLRLDGEHKLLDQLRVGKGVSPRDVLFVQPDGRLGSAPSEAISMVPTLYHFDSFGYHPSVLRELAPGEAESWAWLLDERWRGRTAITAHPPIGIVEMALAAEAKGLMRFKDVGNLEIEEIDGLVALLIEFRHKRHFRAFWESSPQAVALMQGTGVHIESMWPDAFQALNRSGTRVRYAVPREGTRAWMMGLSISARCVGPRLERAYRFVNWWLSGWAGAHLTRHGIYATAPNSVARYLTDDEWRYWYLGLPANSAIADNWGRTVAEPGEARTGGSHVQRMKQVAVWNTFMNEYNYLIRRWRDFMIA
jgi:putative spermidine/putrescine transport system substrate-binding protein